MSGVVILRRASRWQASCARVAHIQRLLTGAKRGHQETVRCGSGISVDHGEKGLALLCGISRPREQVVRWCRSFLSHGPDGETEGKEIRTVSESRYRGNGAGCVVEYASKRYAPEIYQTRDRIWQ